MQYAAKRQYSFIGEQAQNFYDPHYEKARSMLRTGSHPDDIYQQTGWGVGIDGKLRREISDSQMRYYADGSAILRHGAAFRRYRQLKAAAGQRRVFTLEEGKEYKQLQKMAVEEFKRPKEMLCDFVYHPTLFDYYPRLRQTRFLLQPLEGERIAEYDPFNNCIRLDPSLSTNPEESLLHEIQHVIQEIEGFSRGSSSSQWRVLSKELKERIWKMECAMRIFQLAYHIPRESFGAEEQALKSLSRPHKAEQYRRLRQNLHSMKELSRELGNRSCQWFYQQTGGEVEANQAALRRRYSDELRQKRKPAHYDNHSLFDMCSIAAIIGEEIPSLYDLLGNEGNPEEMLVSTCWRRMSEENLMRVAARLSQEWGREVRFYMREDWNGIAENGYYQDGIIYINLWGKHPLSQVFGHELTHSLEGTPAYTQLKARIFQQWQSEGMNLEALRQNKQHLYASQGIWLGAEETDAELVAEFIARILFCRRKRIHYLIHSDCKLWRKIWNRVEWGTRWLPGSQNRRFLRDIRNLYRQALEEQNRCNNGKKQFFFGGEQAAKANMERWQQARNETEAGGLAQEIFAKTGWFIGMDGKWRFEFEDATALFFPLGDARVQMSAIYQQYWEIFQGKQTTAGLSPAAYTQFTAAQQEVLRMRQQLRPQWLEDYFWHPGLWENYPALRKIGLRILPLTEDCIAGWYGIVENEIVLNQNYVQLHSASDIEALLIHEVQHVIQSLEGFTEGVTPEYWRKRYKMLIFRQDGVKRLLKQVEQKHVKGRYLKNLWGKLQRNELSKEEYRQVLRNLIQQEHHPELLDAYWENTLLYHTLHELSQRIDGAQNTDFWQAYRNTAGEIEARNVAERHFWTEEQRRQHFPEMRCPLLREDTGEPGWNFITWYQAYRA